MRNYLIVLILKSLFAGVLVSGATGWAGPTIPPPGLRENTPRVHALRGARIVTAPGDTIEKGTVIIRDGNIEAVGAGVQPPADARVWDLSGKTVYAGFIDLYGDYGMAEAKRPEARATKADQVSGSPNWNPNVTPQRSAAELFRADADAARELRSQGIALVLSLPSGKTIPGTGALLTTGEGPQNDLVVQPDVALGVRYQTSDSEQTYPGSLMGAMALLRQSFLDAEWYGRAQAAWRKAPVFARPEVNESLERLGQLVLARVPLLFRADDEHAFLRSAGLAREFGLPAIVRGSNALYRRLADVKATGLPVVLPVDFPETPSVEAPESALEVSLRQLRHWHLAPENAQRLHEAGVRFAFTSDGLKDRAEFLKSVRRTVKRGLPRAAALAALTIEPARMIGRADRFGTVAAGKAAHLVVTDGDLFDDETEILSVWVDGNRYVVSAEPEIDPRGTWELRLPEDQAAKTTITLTLKGKPGRPEGHLTRDAETKLEHTELTGYQLTFTFTGDSLGFPGVVQMSATVDTAHMLGQGVRSDGTGFGWRARRTAPYDPDSDASSGKGDSTQAPEDSSATAREAQPALKLEPSYPDGAFGRAAPPEQLPVVAFTNATIWTSGPQGNVDRGTLLVRAGKVVAVGESVSIPRDAIIVDVTGMHITPGLIDSHSHTAIEGDVNESEQTISAEVRIGDVIDPDDISIYRELAGGLTVANLLHGSANAIGGHNQVIKLRWGLSAEALKLEGAPPGIKFALGENPKQSNWGEDFTTRYPQTRMGVEEIMRDAFQAAREYEAAWTRFEKTGQGMPPRRDLELETVLEVISGKRLVHCHAYRQDEMVMLMRLAEAYGFRVAAYHHVLEGYKVADQMAAHGVGGAGFSDWWAYKFEVYDAIPYNGALMHEQGVVVSFNSDSDELARRLNTEAAKAVKYGGVPKEEALKFVTINPAIQLGIDRRVGSLEPGKDADIVVWSGDPLSTYSRCEQTWIDGCKYFDRVEDQEARARARLERAHLIQLALTEAGGAKQRAAPPHGRKPHYSCHEQLEGR